jgi:hypothetical protein
MAAVIFPENPTDGDAFQIGNKTYVWIESLNMWRSGVGNLVPSTGLVYRGNSVGNLAVDNRTYTATSGQTDFDVVYSNGDVIVYRNGIKLSLSEYIATNNTSISLVTPADLDDAIDIIGYSVSAPTEIAVSCNTDDIPPSNPREGDLWFNSSNLKTYVYYNDGDSSQWVVTNATGPTGPAGADGADGQNGVTVYATVADLPSSGTDGDMAFVSENAKLYIWNGTNWYTIDLVNEPPTITTASETNYKLALDGTPTVITLAATDPEGLLISWSYEVTNGSLGNTATVTQSYNEFTITPSTNQDDAGSFEITFTAFDGTNTDTTVSTFDLSWAVTLEEMLVVGGGGSGSGGGGGAGGLLYYGTNTDTTGSRTPHGPAPTFEMNQAIDVIVGDGGSAANSGPLGWGGASGEDSYIISATIQSDWFRASGGGGGAAGTAVNNDGGASGYVGRNGGSGGGGGNNGSITNYFINGGNNHLHPVTLTQTYDEAFLAGNTLREGYPGGTGHAIANSPAGGGGGAGGEGGNHDAGKFGGIGLEYDITGTATYYAGGGGGGSHNAGEGVGGLGGGGNGYTNFSAYNSGTDDGEPNTGGGGGGGAGAKSNGGSGIIIMRIPNTVTATGIGFTETAHPDGNTKVLSFTSSGTVTFS